jgi:hypothetical protein
MGMTLSEFDAEIVVRGFDGFTPADRYRYINWGYHAIAKKYLWYWEAASNTFTVNPGDAPIAVDTALPSFRSLQILLGTTANQRRKLMPVSDQAFFDYWLPRDLSIASSRGEPDSYYIYDGNLYILPPPAATRTFEGHYKRRLADMVQVDDEPVTPDHLDEAILLAALARCHKRAQEINLAQVVQIDLEDFLDDMRTDEELLMEEQPDRVRPDDTWL